MKIIVSKTIDILNKSWISVITLVLNRLCECEIPHRDIIIYLSRA